MLSTIMEESCNADLSLCWGWVTPPNDITEGFGFSPWISMDKINGLEMMCMKYDGHAVK